MSDPWIIVAVVLAMLLLLPGFWAWRFIWIYVSARPTRDESWLPRALVILPIRGADPSLRACLLGLVNQDYPNYAVRIIIDSAEDPGWEFIRGVLAENPEAWDKIKI